MPPLESTAKRPAVAPPSAAASPSAVALSSAEMTQVVCGALADGKAEDVVCLRVSHLAGGFFDDIVVATATSARHAAALSDRAVRALRAAGASKPGVEGLAAGEWALIDAGALIVHIMQKEARTKYDLEGLWGFPAASGKDGEDSESGESDQSGGEINETR